jgi:hypothetical protein
VEEGSWKGVHELTAHKMVNGTENRTQMPGQAVGLEPPGSKICLVAHNAKHSKLWP